MFIDRFIDTGELRLKLSMSPEDGPPILFLHGVSRNGRDFAPLFPAVLGSWHVHALDHRGHGQSGRVSGAYRVTDYIRDAVAVVRAFEKPVVLFGHSLGAIAAAAVAGAEPDRVRGVILEDPPSAGFLAKLTRTPYHAQFAAMQKLAGQNRPVSELARDVGNILLPQTYGGSVRLATQRDATMVRFSARCLPELDPAVFDSLIDGTWLQGYDEDAVWRAIKCPVLLLHGEDARGGMLPKLDADRMTNAIPDVSRIDVPGVGHLIHWLATETCTRLMLGFIESL